jgi:PIN domain nuclease of toxin-antitoxin system
MRLLLDTHIFLWSLLDPSQLGENVARELENPGNELWLSPVSTWEHSCLSKRVVSFKTLIPLNGCE